MNASQYNVLRSGIQVCMCDVDNGEKKKKGIQSCVSDVCNCFWYYIHTCLFTQSISSLLEFTSSYIHVHNAQQYNWLLSVIMENHHGSVELKESNYLPDVCW